MRSQTMRWSSALYTLPVVLSLAGCGAADELPAVRGRDIEDAERRKRPEIGQELSLPRHLPEGFELVATTEELVEHGKNLLAADWTVQEGGGRPLTKGTGAPLTDPSSPLVFPNNFNRISGPDANSCAGCHNKPFGIVGGGGDIVANVFVLGQRFDFATFDPLDTTATRGSHDESGTQATLQGIANSRATLGMFGSGYIEMLARQMTAELQAIRDTLAPGGSCELVTKGVSFGTLSRNIDGTWNTSQVVGLPAPSLETTCVIDPPSLIIRPFHQAGAVVSLRQFTNNAFNHHHGIQSVERFGTDTDPDGDGFTNELTVADVTAASVYQAVLNVPVRVTPDHLYVRAAAEHGELVFSEIGCASCHIPSLPLDNEGWIYSEPNPYNPPGNLQVGQVEALYVDLSDPSLPGERLQPVNGIVWVPAFTDLKLHDITDGPDDPNAEPLDMQVAAGSEAFFAGNTRFLTKKLWGAANEAPYFHHGLFSTMREAIEAHGGEAASARASFRELSKFDQDSVIEFLKTLQIPSE